MQHNNVKFILNIIYNIFINKFEQLGKFKFLKEIKISFTENIVKHFCDQILKYVFKIQFNIH